MINGISAVVPVYNEEENVADCYGELDQVLAALAYQKNIEYEIIFVDDGSKDGTLRALKDAVGADPHVVIIEFRRNFGQTAAMAAGLDAARYEAVVTLDGDLQNDPCAIPSMLEKLEEGYDLVAGWRKNRKDKALSRKLPSKIANWLISKSTNVRLHDYGCTLKMMRSEIAKGIKLYGEMHRFIPALAYELGARIYEMPVNHRPRLRGVSKYGISRTIRVVLDLLTVKYLLGFSKRPIHLFGPIGIACSGIGSALIVWLTYQKYFWGASIGSRPMLTLAVMLVIVGLQFLVFGLIAEVLARTYYESQGKKIYLVRNIFRGSVFESEGQGALGNQGRNASANSSKIAAVG